MFKKLYIIYIVILILDKINFYFKNNMGNEAADKATNKGKKMPGVHTARVFSL